MLGEYEMSREVKVRTAGCVFKVPSGVKVIVQQYDKEHNKVLIDFGCSVDWFHESWLVLNADAVQRSSDQR